MVSPKSLTTVTTFSKALAIILFIGLPFLGFYLGIAYEKALNENPRTSLPQKYLLNNSEGSCSKSSDCQWAGLGCSGGHGICTNKPDKYKGIITTCDVNQNFPSNLGYACTCVQALGKCGWVK